MLTELTISNFILIKHIEIKFKQYLTCITGQTGAGKSIILHALSIISGDKKTTKNLLADPNHNSEIIAVFNLKSQNLIKTWLIKNDLNNEENHNLLHIRRVINIEGHSKIYINGHNVPLLTLKTLGKNLIYFHHQHYNLKLLNSNYQREILDKYANLNNKLIILKQVYQKLAKINASINNLQQSNANKQQQLEFIKFQLQELHDAQLQQDEYNNLNQEYKNLSVLANNQEQLKQILQLFDNNSNDNSSIINQINYILNLLKNIKITDEKFLALTELLTSTQINLNESFTELTGLYNNANLDQDRLTEINNRLDLLNKLAQKHNLLNTNDLYQKLLALEKDYNNLNQLEHNIYELKQQQQELITKYKTISQEISKIRITAAERLTNKINSLIKKLELKNCQLKISITKTDNISELGSDNINFLIKTNLTANNSFEPLTKIISGGELSRVALALQIISNQITQIPILIFDEIDTGLNGAVAEIMGHLLQDTSRDSQIICITHLPQIAACADQHLYVKKSTQKQQTITSITELSINQRITELAKMSGGINITKENIAHAKELIKPLILAKSASVLTS